jgi:hypothetical protein
VVVLDYVEESQTRCQVLAVLLCVYQGCKLVVVPAHHPQQGLVGLLAFKHQLLSLVDFAHLETDVELHLLESVAVLVHHQVCSLLRHRVEPVGQIQCGLMKLSVLFRHQLSIVRQIFECLGIILGLEVDFCPFEVHLCVVTVEINGNVEIVEGLFFVGKGALISEKDTTEGGL